MLAFVIPISYSCTPGIFKSENDGTTEFWSFKGLGDPRITERYSCPQFLARLGHRRSEKIKKKLGKCRVLELENVIDLTHFTDVEIEPLRAVVAFLVSKTLGAPFTHEDHSLSPRLFLFI